MICRYLSVCSGLEGASLAWNHLGWTPVGFSEIEKFPSAIIAHHYGSNMPGEPLSRNAPPNFGDFTAIDASTLGAVDILVGGTPCQAFSVAGARRSLSDARGNLSLAFTVLAYELARSNGLRNVVWENVPGVLSTPDNAFGCFLGALVGAYDALPLPRGIERWPDAGMVAGPRARAAWRVLDAQYFGLAQRRERVFLVADFGTGADPAQVLFERQSLQGNSPPRRESREGIAPTISARTKGGGGLGTDFDLDGGLIPIAEIGASFVGQNTNNRGVGVGQPGDPMFALTASKQHAVCRRQDFEIETFIAHALRADGFDASEDGTGRGTPLVPVCFSSKDHGADAQDDIAPTLRAMGFDKSHANAGGQLAVAFDMRGREGGSQFEGPHDTANIRAASGGSSRSYVATQWAVRRLMPVECERLQGIPDGYTAIPWRGKPASECPNGNRYKAIGNSWAVPIISWIGERINAALEARQ